MRYTHLASLPDADLMAIWMDGIVSVLVGETEVYFNNRHIAKAALKELKRRHKGADQPRDWCVCEVCCGLRPDPF